MITLLQALLVGLIYYAANTSFLCGLAYFTTWRPLVNGFLVGLALGDPVRGAMAGGLVNVLYLGYLSVGGTLGIGDAALAGITGAVAAIALPLPHDQAIGVGAIAGLLLGNLGFPLLSLRMKLDGRIVRRMDQAAERGDARAVMLWNILPAQALLFGLTVPTATVLAISISLLCASAAALPPWLLRGLAVSGNYLASALGIALAMRWVFKKRGVALFLAGAIVAAIPGSAVLLAASSGAGQVAIAVCAAAAIPIVSKRMRPRGATGERVPRSAFWLWQFFSHSAYSFERLQGSGFACALAPSIRRWYAGAGAGERAAALARHLAFFNTEVNLGSMIVSIAAGMERERASGQLDAVDADIGRVKSQLMGTLAGAGDPIIQGAILPAILSLGLVILFGGGVLIEPAIPALLYAAAIGAVMFALSHLSFRAGHVYGRDAAVRLLANRPFRRVAAAAEQVGALALGMLAMQVTAANTPAVNGSALNPLLELGLSLSLILALYTVMQRLQVKPLYVLVALVAAGVTLAGFGVI